MSLNNKHCIHINIDKRKHLYTYLDKLKNFQLTNAHQKVALVEKDWFDGFIEWLQHVSIPPPGKIRVKNLFSHGKFNPILQLHKDFEIIDSVYWEELIQTFGFNAKLVKYCRYHPITKNIVILVTPIQISFYYLDNSAKQKMIKEAVDSNWKLSILKDHICKRFKIENSSLYSFFNNDEEVQLDLTCSDVIDKYQGKIHIKMNQLQLKLFDNISEKYSHYPIVNNINNLPLPVDNKGEKSDSESSYDDSDYSSPPIPKRPVSRLNRNGNNNLKIIKPMASNLKPASNLSNLNKINNSSSKNLNSAPLKKDKENKDENVEHSDSKSKISYRSTIIKYPMPIGLQNLGNTCFFNASVQCLIRCQSLTNFILSPDCLSHVNLKNPLGSKGKIVSAYRELLQKMQGSNESKGINKNSYYLPSYYQYDSPYSSLYSSAINPSNLHSIISSKFPIFEDFGQNDAQELVGSLLDGLHEDLNQSNLAKGNNSPYRLPSNPDSWDVYLSKNSSPIMDIFNGKLFRSILCPCCNHKFVVYDPFMFLSLPIPSSSHTTTNNYDYGYLSKYNYGNYRFSNPYSSPKKVTLADCFNSFTQSETLDGHNLWKCEKCHKEVNATVKSGISQAPEILIIHLKRFDGQSYFMKKIDTSVEYPDILDLSNFQDLSSSQNSLTSKYNLIGVVFHSGSLSGGHYTSAAFDPDSKKWYEFNDSFVSSVSKEQVHSSKAYILFYQRC